MSAARESTTDRLELAIGEAECALIAAKTPEQKRSALAILEALVKSRSPARVREMERERGLR